MLQPLLPLGPSVSLLEPECCTPELGHIVAVPAVLQHFGSPDNCDTLTWMLCVVQSCDTSVKRSCESSWSGEELHRLEDLRGEV